MKKNYILSVLFFLFLGIIANAQNLPTAVGDEANAMESTPITIDFLQNDSFGEDGPNTDPVAIISNPLHGEVQLINSPNPNGQVVLSIIYSPFPNFVGVDSFLYTIKDANGDTSTATISIFVQGANGIATAANDYATTNENTPITINVLENDNFGFNNPTSGYSYVSINPSNGVAVLNDNGTPYNPLDDTFVYTPNLNFYGQDSFSYTITNSADNSASATVFINVIQNPNDPNGLVAIDDQATSSLNTFVTINVLANDNFGINGPNSGYIFVNLNPSNGSAVVNDNGTPSNPTDDTFEYMPNLDFYGQDFFSYTITDSSGNTASATVFINVLQNPIEPNVPTAANDYLNTEINTAITINALANDSFGTDGANVGSILVSSNPLNGTVLVNDNGTPNDPTDDVFVYTPNVNYLGFDNFNYSISDANGDSSSATVYVNVIMPNPLPALFEKTAVLQGNGNVGDTIIYTFKITNTTGGTMSSISVFDQMLSPLEIHFVGGLAPGDMDTFNYPYTITQNDVNAGFVSNSATVMYTDFNYSPVSSLSDDGDLSNGTDNQTITYLNNFPSVVIDVIQPSCAETTGSIVLSNLPSNWIFYYNNSSIESNYNVYTISNLPIGAYNCILIDLNNSFTQTFYVNIQSPSSGITAGATGTYVDYNNDGFTNVGDVINYQYSVFNNGSCDLTNVGISPTPFLNLEGTTIPVLASQTSDNITLFGTHVITQEEVNAGNVLLNNGLFYTSGTSTYAIDVFNFTNLTITNGFKLNAFLDTNNNGLQDNNEPNFGDGYFTYQLNNGTINNIYSQNGSYYLYEVDPNNVYNITYVLNNQYNQCTGQYVLNTSSYSNVSISNNGFQILNFAINDGVCNDLAVTMNNGWFSPRPGFNYSNVIYYSNYGNQTISSGSITFTKDALLSITNVSETAITNNSNGFSYNFTNLLPYETRYIFVDMLVPLIPNINLGDIVTNTVTASTNVADGSLSNNSATITDIVIGSYDPNDKNESHGGKVLHSGFTANDYLTYTIRFENTGTAEAINVKVTDVLDQKLDETSIRMIAASDDYVLDRIGSNLTWTFSGINLVPSVENTKIGHGYLTFQVKPKTGYLLGDVIPNTANIYFDFNPAIVTNECTTEFVSALAVNNFSENDFSVYPNPTKNTLNISAKNKANTIENIVVFDVVGKAILNQKANTPTTTIDLSNFAKGVYFVKVTGNGFEKIIKVVRD